MEIDKLEFNDVFDVYVFDDSGNLVSKLDTLKSVEIKTDLLRNLNIHLKDSILNMELLRFFDKSEVSDFDYYLDTMKNPSKGSCMAFPKNQKLCKVIIVSKGRNLIHEKDHNVTIVINRAVIVMPSGMFFGNSKATNFVWTIKCLASYDNEENISVHITPESN